MLDSLTVKHDELADGASGQSGRSDSAFNTRMHTRTCVGVKSASPTASLPGLNLKCINERFLYFHPRTGKR